MDFGQALDGFRDGSAITRKTWIWATESLPAKELLKPIRFNANRLKAYEYGVPFVVLMSALELPAFNAQNVKAKVSDRTAKWIGPDTKLNSNAYFSHYDPDTNVWQPGWLPGVADILAVDWVAL